LSLMHIRRLKASLHSPATFAAGSAPGGNGGRKSRCACADPPAAQSSCPVSAPRLPMTKIYFGRGVGCGVSCQWPRTWSGLCRAASESCEGLHSGVWRYSLTLDCTTARAGFALWGVWVWLWSGVMVARVAGPMRAWLVEGYLFWPGKRCRCVGPIWVGPVRDGRGALRV